MHTLSAHDIIGIWERSQGQHPVDQALTMLAAALHDLPFADLAALSIGRRDAMLLELYSRTFGGALDSLADCPHCRETLEFSLDADALGIGPAEALTSEHHMQAHGYTVDFRLPNSFDLASIAGLEAADVAIAQTSLLQRCVLRAEHDGAAADVAALPDAVAVAVAAEMSARDPQADLLLSLTCPACGYAWQAVFDITTFLWSRLRRQAQRLLLEVHTLAQAYGWREAEILALSPARRRCYLDMLS